MTITAETITGVVLAGSVAGVPLSEAGAGENARHLVSAVRPAIFRAWASSGRSSPASLQMATICW